MLTVHEPTNTVAFVIRWMAALKHLHIFISAEPWLGQCAVGTDIVSLRTVESRILTGMFSYEAAGSFLPLVTVRKVLRLSGF